jgi:hypothetical protein
MMVPEPLPSALLISIVLLWLHCLNTCWDTSLLHLLMQICSILPFFLEVSPSLVLSWLKVKEVRAWGCCWLLLGLKTGLHLNQWRRLVVIRLTNSHLRRRASDTCIIIIYRLVSSILFNYWRTMSAFNPVGTAPVDNFVEDLVTDILPPLSEFIVTLLESKQLNSVSSQNTPIWLRARRCRRRNIQASIQLCLVWLLYFIIGLLKIIVSIQRCIEVSHVRRLWILDYHEVIILCHSICWCINQNFARRNRIRS